MTLDAQKAVALKLGEPDIDSSNPWVDDLLARKDITIRLTNLVATQEPPLSISLHGQWGTGKTFLLRRWQKTLELDGYQAIYFNAWEDDFCDDPLLAMIGHLAGHFEGNKFKELARRVAEIALPLIKENLLGVLKATTGVTIKLDQQEQGSKTPLDAYLEQRATKDQLKSRLAQLSEEVARETGHPLVFIIDELDRCRPTFAIELLERVKHIFDVPHIVFVFGLNRDELTKSLSSVYGDINTDVYLRRFFDFEFNISEADSQGFALHLMEKFQLGQVFQSLTAQARNNVHVQDFQSYMEFCPKLWSALSLSLRDIDYSIRLLAVLTKTIPVGTSTNPLILGILIGMKFKKPQFYYSLITGDFLTSEIMDYIDGELRRDQIDYDLSYFLDRTEGFLYCADSASRNRSNLGEEALVELQSVGNGSSGISFSVISRRAQSADQRRLDEIRQGIDHGRQLGINARELGRLATLIDTHQTELRR